MVNETSVKYQHYLGGSNKGGSESLRIFIGILVIHRTAECHYKKGRIVIWNVMSTKHVTILCFLEALKPTKYSHLMKKLYSWKDHT